MKRTTLNFVLALAMASLTGGTQAITHRCVSKDKSWSPAGITGSIKNSDNIQTAASAIDANGDIIWVQDGFVMDSGNGVLRTGITGEGYARLQIGMKTGSGRSKKYYNYTLRSESGYVDEAAGKGVTIRCDNSTTARGGNAMCPVRCDNEKTILMGFILEGGSTCKAKGLTKAGAGGAVYGACVLTNCVIRNCEAAAGGAIADTTTTKTKLYNCVISNCVAYGDSVDSHAFGGAIYGSASLYNCKLINNSATSEGGAVYHDGSANSVYSNCVFSGNSALSAGGLYLAGENAAVDHVKVMDCRITDNCTKGGWGGVYGAATLSRCYIAGNSVESDGAHAGGVGAASESGTRPILSDCVVSNNVALGCGGGLYCCVATNCVIQDNKAKTSSGVGGGAYGSDLTLCKIIGNEASHHGGGVASGNLQNCLVTKNWAKYYGAAHSCAEKTYACYNCLFAYNTCEADAEQHDNKGMIIADEDAETPMTLINCTIAGNTNEANTACYGIINCANITNCIVWANAKTNPTNELIDCTVGYSCQKGLEAGKNGNIQSDPNFTSDYHLATPLPCADVALAYGWMDNANDVRSRDVDTNFRVCADGPDMGCFERKDTGIVIIVK